MSEVHLGGLAPVLVLLAEADLEEQDLTSGRPGGAPLHVHRAGGDGLEVDVGRGLRHRLQGPCLDVQQHVALEAGQ